MHELAVTESVLNTALDHARKVGAQRVTDVYLRVGQLSSIVDDSVQFYWDLISADTLCAGAKLHFERIAARFTCLDCGTTFDLRDELTPCPVCGSERINLISGDEFYLDAIEVVTPEEETV
jgi:hydrogenase nickel incorporation protein HypA/HybF